MNNGLKVCLMSLACASAVLEMPVFAADPPDKTVRVFFVLPNDKALDSAYPRGIGKVMLSSQKYFMAQCGYTFRLNNPICEVIRGTHPTSWYTNPDDYWTIVNQGTTDLYSILPTVNADGSRSRWKIVVYVLAESPADGGGGGGGWVGLPKHDADGARGYPADTARWCGGMCHELGHCFGLPDASYTDGTVMSASFYSWPNCIFNAGHISTMRNLAANSGFWTTTATKEPMTKPSTAAPAWELTYGNGTANIEFTTKTAEPVTIGLLDISGKTVLRPQHMASVAGTNVRSIDVRKLKSGIYLCFLKYAGSTSIKKFIKKS